MLDVEGVVEVKEVGVVEDVETDILDDCATELLVVVAELAELAELVDVEVGMVVPPEDEAK